MAKSAFFQKDFPSAPKLLGHSRDPKRCPKRPRAPPYHVNLHLNSPKLCFGPISASRSPRGCTRPRQRDRIGSHRLESTPGHPLGSTNTRAGLWRPARPRGAAPKSGLPRFPPKRRARVAGGTCTDQPRAAGGARRLARSWGTYRRTNTPKGGPGPCPLAPFYICETNLCQLVKTLLYDISDTRFRCI